MHRNHTSNYIKFLFLVVVLLIVVLLGCNPTATRAPTSTSDYIVPTVVALETELAHQATQVTTLSAPTPTTTRPTFTPVSTPLANLSTHTPTSTMIESFLSPDGSRLAFVQNLGTLIIQEEGSQQRELLVTDEISSLAWFPDGRHIVYSDRDISQQVMARQDRLWIVNVETGEKHQIDIGYVPRPGNVPCISPGGDYIAVLSGTFWGDACVVGYGLAVLELDDTLQPVAIYRQTNFEGLPEEDELESFYPVSTKDLTDPVRWLNDTQLMVGFKWGCVQRGTEGVYLLDITTLQASKIGDLKDD